MKLLIAWIINACALFALPYVMSSIKLGTFTTALLVAAVLGLLNTLIRPILLILTLPINILTLGLFTFVLNGLLFWGVAKMIDGFDVGGFWSAVFGALLYSIISWAISALVLGDQR